MKRSRAIWLRFGAPLLVVITITLAGSAMITAGHLTVENEILLQVPSSVSANATFPVRALLFKGLTASAWLENQDVELRVNHHAQRVHAENGVAVFHPRAPSGDFLLEINAAGIHMERRIAVGESTTSTSPRTGAFRHSFTRTRTDSPYALRFANGLCSDGEGDCILLLHASANTAVPHIQCAGRDVACVAENQSDGSYFRCAFSVVPPQENCTLDGETIELPIAYATPSLRVDERGYTLYPPYGTTKLSVHFFRNANGHEQWQETRWLEGDQASMHLTFAELEDVSRIELEGSPLTSDNMLVVRNPSERSIAARYALAEEEMSIQALPSFASSRPEQERDFAARRQRVRMFAYFALAITACVVFIWLRDFWRDAARTRKQLREDWQQQLEEPTPSDAKGAVVAVIAAIALLLATIAILSLQLQ